MPKAAIYKVNAITIITVLLISIKLNIYLSKYKNSIDGRTIFNTNFKGNKSINRILKKRDIKKSIAMILPIWHSTETAVTK